MAAPWFLVFSFASIAFSEALTSVSRDAMSLLSFKRLCFSRPVEPSFELESFHKPLRLVRCHV
ncbi:hypothetical protein L1049_002878 [Liquidambar formosana]|uniref:Secreted protein n=1 Tax=Liquidambar formosana TaxID=63359 RepID=A0AAP0R7S3_LIQFO